MDKNIIKNAMESGVPLPEMSETAALTLLNNRVMEVYVKNGLHRQMTQERFDEEVKFCASSLYRDILSDKSYARLRDVEIGYMFTEGLKGRLGSDKDIVVTYKSLLRWIEGYVRHQEYKEARRLYLEERRPVTLAIKRREWTDEDSRRLVEDAYADYADYRRRKYVTRYPAPPKTGQVKTVGEALGLNEGSPASLADFGRLRILWLMSKGYARDGEKLVDVFARAYANGGNFVSVV